MVAAAVAEPQGSWPCRRLGPAAWPPAERQAWVEGCVSSWPVAKRLCDHPPTVSGAPVPLPSLLTWARILRAGPNFSPMVVSRCSSVNSGKVSPSIPCSLKTLAYSPQPDRPPTKLQTSSTVHLLTSSGAVASSPSVKSPPTAPELGVGQRY